ncbi:MAG: ribosome maturation factor RimM [Chloroflexota bacterium]|nr:ribosome maturation factor RimM [Chloroflexota bacterium]
MATVEDESSPRFLIIGEILRPQGVRGEVRVRILTDFPERFRTLKRAYLGQALAPVNVERAHFHQKWVLLKFAGYNDRTAAEELRGALIQIPVEEAIPLEEDEYYLHQIVGLGAWTVEDEYLGRVREILPTGSNDIYVVWGPKGEILLPAIEEVIHEVDLEAGRLTVKLLEGLV